MQFVWQDQDIYLKFMKLGWVSGRCAGVEYQFSQQSGFGKGVVLCYNIVGVVLQHC